MTLNNLQITDKLTRTNYVVDFDNAQQLMEVAFPPSYKQFATKYGFGLTGELLLIFIPLVNKVGKEYPDSVTKRSLNLKGMLLEGVGKEYFEYEPDGSPDLLKRLTPFGISENGHTICWDTGDIDNDGEYRIYIIGSKLLSVTKGPYGLDAFINECQDLTRVKSLLGPGYEPLSATFKPIAPVS